MHQVNDYFQKLLVFIHCILVLMVFVLSFSAKSYSETLKLTTVDWQPFYGNDLPEKGFFSAIAREAFKRAGYEIEIEFQPWKRALESTKKGYYDGLLGAYYDQKRADYFIYSDEVFENKDIFIGKNTQLVSYKELNELKGYRIGAIRGSSYSDELKDKGFNVVDVNDDLQSLRMLLRNRIDLVLMSQIHFNYLLEYDLELYSKHQELVVLDKPFQTYFLYCPILKKRHNSDEIVNRFNDALTEIKEDGTFDNILKRYNFFSTGSKSDSS